MNSNPDIRDQIVALHLKGMTYGQIKYATGLSRGTIGGHLARWRAAEGMEDGRVNGRHWTASEDDDLAQMFMAGATKEAIAKRLGRTSKAIDSRLSILKQDGGLTRAKDAERPGYDAAYVRSQRQADAKFVRALAESFRRGDHLPACPQGYPRLSNEVIASERFTDREAA